MTREGMIAYARHRAEQKSKSKHFSDESVMNLKRACDFKIEKLEKENIKLKEIIKKLLGLYFTPIVTEDDLKKQDEIIKQAKELTKE